MFHTLRTIGIAAAIGLSTGAMAAVQTVTLDVPGMTCSSCPIMVKKTLLKVDGVEQVIASFEKREAVVTFEDTKTSVKELISVTTAAGYPCTVKTEKSR